MTITGLALARRKDSLLIQDESGITETALANVDWDALTNIPEDLLIALGKPVEEPEEQFEDEEQDS